MLALTIPGARDDHPGAPANGDVLPANENAASQGVDVGYYSSASTHDGQWVKAEDNVGRGQALRIVLLWDGVGRLAE